MKKIALAMILILTLNTLAFASIYDDGYYAGKRDAKAGHSTAWGIGGFVGGFALGLIGTGVCYLIAGGEVEVPDEGMHNKQTEYRRGYEAGYNKIARQQNKSSALTGGLVGVLAIVVLIAGS